MRSAINVNVSVSVVATRMTDVVSCIYSHSSSSYMQMNLDYLATEQCQIPHVEADDRVSIK